MNLHGIVAPVIGVVNQNLPAELRVSVGQAAAGADGITVPAYATPGAITASITGNVLTVTAVASGVLQVGQQISGANVAAGTLISALGTVAGTYILNRIQAADVASEAMTTSRPIIAQVQPVSWKDLQQVQGLNLQGSRYKLYLYGRSDGAVRPLAKGGDLVTIATGGPSDGAYLVAQSLEQFPDWVAVFCTLQNSP